MTALASPPAAAAELLPEWRLDDLYAGRDDPRIERDLQAAAEANGKIATLEGKLLAARGDASRARPTARRGRRPLRGGGEPALGRRRLRQPGDLDRARRSGLGQVRGRHARPRVADRRRVASSSPWSSTSWRTRRSRRRLRAHAPAARWRPWLRRVRLAAAARAVGATWSGCCIDRAPGAWPTGAGSTTRPWPRMPVKAGRETLTLPEALNRLSDPDAGAAQDGGAGPGQGAGAEQPDPGALPQHPGLREAGRGPLAATIPTPPPSRHIANEVDAEAVAGAGGGGGRALPAPVATATTR